MIAGLDSNHPVDALFINSPLKDYDIFPRHNDFTLPVLGLGYIATYARHQGFNVGVLDSEALGFGISKIASIVNEVNPRWVGLNLLAPTYRHSIEILRSINSEVLVMLGGHQAKAMPKEILQDLRIPRIDALLLGEGEYRVAELLGNIERRETLPGLYWRNELGNIKHGGLVNIADMNFWLAPDIDALPFINREYLIQDPFMATDGLVEANLVGSRGCPYDCSFCGAAVSANPDVSIRTRNPENIVAEMEQIAKQYGVTAFRFVDDLFLASPPFMKKCLPLFKKHGIAEKFVWDATGRINVLSRASDELLNFMKEAGCREVALGIESGNERLLKYMGKRITPEMTSKAVEALTRRGINVKGYFILGFPTETLSEIKETIQHIRHLWEISDKNPGNFRCSAFEFRPYPGTPEWQRLMKTGKYKSEDLLLYEHVDLTDNGQLREMLERDEFNFSVNLQFGEVSLPVVRNYLTQIMVEQKQKLGINQDYVQRLSFT